MGSFRLFRLMFFYISLLCTFLNSACEQPLEKIVSVNTISQSEDEVAEGGVYRAPLLNNPPTLDPAYVQDEYGTAVVQQVFDGLVRFDPYLLVLPALAETWQVGEDGKSYRFFLQKTARFHNGAPVNAEDVIFSISRLLRVVPSPAILPHLLKITGARAYKEHKTEKIAGLQAEGEKTVVIQLEEPHAPFLTALGMYQVKVLPKKEVLRLGDKFGLQPVGSGPFRFVSWEPDERIKIERYPDYFAGKAFLDGVEFSIYPGGEIDQLIADFKAGKLDEMLVLGNARELLSLEKDLQWFHRPALSMMFYGLRVDQPPLDDPELRRRLSDTIDREKLLSDVYSGQFEPAVRILPPGMPGVSQQNDVKNERVLVEEKDELSKLVRQEGRTLTLEIVSGSKSAYAQAELSFIRKAWAKLGIDLQIKYITDWSRFEEYINSNQVQIYRYAWYADMPDPDSFLYPLFASNSPANFMRFKSKKVDQLLLSARGESNPAKRAKLYRDIEVLILEATPIIPLINPSVDRVYKSFVQGAQPSALGAPYMSLHRVWKKTDNVTR